jgi:hypothetical protein
MLLRSQEGSAIGIMAATGGTEIKVGNGIESGGIEIVTGTASVAGGTVTATMRPVAIGTGSAN